MALDQYTPERLAYCHIADSQIRAEGLRTLEGLEDERRQGEQLLSTPWVWRLFRSLATGDIPTLRTLQRL